MNTTVVSTKHDVTLVTLQSSPTKITFIADVCEKIASRGINIDMISMAPAHGPLTSLSFTIDDEDLVSMLSFTSELKKEMDIKAVMSSVNHKISVHDANMKNTPGFASKLFAAIRKSNCDILLITTSEVDISLLVSDADYDNVFEVVTEAFKD